MSDYKERLKEERGELLDKIRKLDVFLCKPAFKELSLHQQHLLEVQWHAMDTYLTCLNKRLIEIENI